LNTPIPNHPIPNHPISNRSRPPIDRSRVAMLAQSPPSEAQLYSLVDRLLAQTPNAISAKVALHVQTLGGFRVWRGGDEVPTTAWGREKAIHLFQFFITMRRQYVH